MSQGLFGWLPARRPTAHALQPCISRAAEVSLPAAQQTLHAFHNTHSHSHTTCPGGFAAFNGETKGKSWHLLTAVLLQAHSYAPESTPSLLQPSRRRPRTGASRRRRATKERRRRQQQMQPPRPLDHRGQRGALLKVREGGSRCSCRGLLCRGQQQAPSR